MEHGGYITLDERHAYGNGRIAAHEARRLFGLQGVMRDVRRAAKDARSAADASLLGRESFGFRVAAARACGMIDTALAIVQRVK